MKGGCQPLLIAIIGSILAPVGVFGLSFGASCELQNETGALVTIKHLINAGATERVELTTVPDGERVSIKDWSWSRLEIQHEGETWKYSPCEPLGGALMFRAVLLKSGTITMLQPGTYADMVTQFNCTFLRPAIKERRTNRRKRPPRRRATAESVSDIGMQTSTKKPNMWLQRTAPSRPFQLTGGR